MVSEKITIESVSYACSYLPTTPPYSPTVSALGKFLAEVEAKRRND